MLPLKGGKLGIRLAHAFSVTADLLAHSYGGVCQQMRGTPTVGICTVPNCVLYLATFCYISLEKTRLPVLSDPRLVCVPADNIAIQVLLSVDGF